MGSHSPSVVVTNNAPAVMQVSNLDVFWDHIDGAAGALGGADAAALAVVVVELEVLAGPELDHRVVRAPSRAERADPGPGVSLPLGHNVHFDLCQHGRA